MPQNQMAQLKKYTCICVCGAASYGIEEKKKLLWFPLHLIEVKTKKEENCVRAFVSKVETHAYEIFGN